MTIHSINLYRPNDTLCQQEAAGKVVTANKGEVTCAVCRYRLPFVPWE